MVSSKEAIQALERLGFVRSSSRGSHRKLRHPDGRGVI
jgi:predicted RNA binding protein YcfA (HicA-like mRNA interferase family)